MKAEVHLVKEEVLLERDRFGLQSSYVAQAEGKMWYSSDLKALLNSLPTRPALDPIALHGYLCFSYVPNPLTLFQGVTALPAGSRYRLTPQGIEPLGTRLWRELPPFATDEEEALQTLQALLRDSVRKRLGEAKEVGVFLSGGLDSSLIAALLHEAGARLRLYTLDFGAPWNAELPFAQQVAAHLGHPLTVVSASPSSVRFALKTTVRAMHQPFGDGVTVPLMLLGQSASGRVETVFNGEGGDQLFGGWANKPMIAAEMYGERGYQREAGYLNTLHRFYGLTDSLYTPEMRRITADTDVGAWIRPALQGGEFSTLLHRLRAANFTLKGAQNIAPRCVQIAAEQGLKVEAPFFDEALTEWSFSLPPEWFLQGACEKYLLKRLADHYLPSGVVWREKRGMGVPVTEWCLSALRRDIAHSLSPRHLKRQGLFQPAFVQGMLKGEMAPGDFRRRRLGEKLWAFWIYHLWQEEHA